MKNRILIAGDAMLDEYRFGSVNRLSPDGAAPVFLESGPTGYRPGGAANVAVNLAGAGAQSVLLAEVGDDPEGRLLLNLLRQEGTDVDGVTVRTGGITTRKLRYVSASGRVLIRADREYTAAPERDAGAEIPESILDGCSLLILSDYRKGFLTEGRIRRLMALAAGRSVPVFVDASGEDPGRYPGAALLKPNRKTLSSLTGLPVGTYEEACRAAVHLCRLANCRWVLATLDRDGMILCDSGGCTDRWKNPAGRVRDTTGAGDTALAYFAAFYAEKKPLRECLSAAGRAAALQVMEAGTRPVRREELEYVKTEADDRGPDGKEQMELLSGIRAAGKKIVFTNGCFDILHAGHVQCLAAARQMGDFLIVGLNSDASVRRLKGANRPFHCQADRIAVLSALSCVDLVIPFEEDTPLRLIQAIRPDVLVKGGDYREEEIVGSAFVRSCGGEVRTVPLLKGRSTTAAGRFLREEGRIGED